MKKTFLIMNAQTPQGRALDKNLKQRGHKTLLVTTDETSSLKWNPRSPLSIQTLIHQLPDNTDLIDGIFFPLEIPELSGDLKDLKTADIENITDTYIKGTILASRELLTRPINKADYFRFTFLLMPSDSLNPLAGAVTGALRGFAQNLVINMESDQLHINGYEIRIDDPERSVQAMLKNEEEKGIKTNGRWIRFGEKTGLFGLGKSR